MIFNLLILTFIFFYREDLLESIMKRVGLDIFLDKLRSVSKSEKFSSASQKPQIKILKADQLIFDYEFCKLFRTLEGNSPLNSSHH